MCITTSYIGNKPIEWVPYTTNESDTTTSKPDNSNNDASTTAATASEIKQTSSPDNEDALLRDCFQKYIRGKIKATTSSKNAPVEVAKKRRRLAAILMLFRDPTYMPPGLDVKLWDLREQPSEEYFQNVLESLLDVFDIIERIWVAPCATLHAEDDAGRDGCAESPEDRKARGAVQKARAFARDGFDHRTILTNASDPVMHHVVPQELTRALNAKLIWRKLCDAFPLGPWDSAKQRMA
ncbi:hypothetical protein SCUCBS95973_003554 [Sporothrix curviconia]|uniref:Uncharacterized protein n=1 Tax=Sporothrix curviconia TaxID=1260050 RepID=A0ABP0BGE9_9PEZI